MWTCRRSCGTALEPESVFPGYPPHGGWVSWRIERSVPTTAAQQYRLQWRWFLLFLVTKRQTTCCVLQTGLPYLAGLRIQHCDLLKPRVKITAYHQHARLLSSESWSVRHCQVYPALWSRRRYSIKVIGNNENRTKRMEYLEAVITLKGRMHSKGVPTKVCLWIKSNFRNPFTSTL